MKITETGWYRRRDGGKARVVCVDAGKVNFPVIAIHETEQRPAWHTIDGEYARGSIDEADLIAPWQDPTPGSLEWARGLPPETKLWHPSFDANGWVRSQTLICDSAACNWHIVGSASWANALPEGTRVRKSTSLKTTWIARQGDRWNSETIADIRGPEGDGWLLHREPTIRPWRAEEVPVGAQIRNKDDIKRTRGCSLITYVDSGGIPLPSGNEVAWIKFCHLLDQWEHSTDPIGTPENKRTWAPCGVMEATP